MNNNDYFKKINIYAIINCKREGLIDENSGD